MILLETSLKFIFPHLTPAHPNLPRFLNFFPVAQHVAIVKAKKLIFTRVQVRNARMSELSLVVMSSQI